MYGGTLTPPTARNSSAANILHFNQSLYLAGDGSLAPDAYVYIPPACAAGSGTTCRLHIAFHGCGQYAGSAAVGTSFVEHAGFNPWADANDLVILYPQGGGFPDSGQQAPSNQLAAGCWDGYGQTGIDFAYQSGPQVVAVRNMITALAGW
jgi:poly(3-hydroxybutyrate) depolymerase